MKIKNAKAAKNCKKRPKNGKTEKVQKWKLTRGHLPLCLPTKKYIKPPQKNDESGPKRQKQPKTAPKHQNANFSKFPRCPIFKFFVVTREVICQKMAPILDPVNFFWVFSLLGHCGGQKWCWIGGNKPRLIWHQTSNICRLFQFNICSFQSHAGCIYAAVS